MTWVKVFESSNSHEAYLVRDYLRAKGVRVEMRGEGLVGLLGALPVADALPSLWVAPDTEALARAALRRFEHEDVGGERWTCTECGEINEPSFGSCWQCGALHPTHA